jgi:hypothetical protein
LRKRSLLKEKGRISKPQHEILSRPIPDLSHGSDDGFQASLPFNSQVQDCLTLIIIFVWKIEINLNKR